MPLPLFELAPAAQQAWLRERLERPPPHDARSLSDGYRLPGRTGPPTPAAVLLPLINRADGLNVLFTERSRDVPDHAGQISFPGGRVEPGDADVGVAALREAEEEVGLPRDRVTLLGRLADYETVTGYRVTPIVGWVEPPFKLKADPVEVADVFEVPLAFLLEPANQQRHFQMVNDVRRDYYAISYGERYIWGATAAMLLIFERTLRAPEIMLAPRSDHDIAVLLPGGGARAAYQVGALRAVARIVSRSTRQPFRIICGTSAGAINAATLAMHADNFRCGVARLLQWWNTMGVSMIYHADVAHVALHGMRWFASVLVGAGGPKEAASMLDNAPLRGFLNRHLELGRIDEHVRSGALRAVAINATSYTTGHAVTFYQGADTIAPWRRTRRRGEPAVLTIEHLLASTAIPFVFPAERVGEDYFADGSVRQITPLSPALHLGARRILVVAVGQFGGQRSEVSQPPRYPSFAQMAGHALASIFLDNLGADLERMQRLNQVLHLVSETKLQRNPNVAHIDALVLGPSQDLGAMALPHAARLPMGVRYLLHGLGSTRGTGTSLLSYLMFEREYCRALLDLGFRDAMARRDEIEAFLAPEGTRYDPMFPLELA